MRSPTVPSRSSRVSFAALVALASIAHLGCQSNAQGPRATPPPDAPNPELSSALAPLWRARFDTGRVVNDVDASDGKARP